jgi:hypothetical protein
VPEFGKLIRANRSFTSLCAHGIPAQERKIDGALYENSTVCEPTNALHDNKKDRLEPTPGEIDDATELVDSQDVLRVLVWPPRDLYRNPSPKLVPNTDINLRTS